MEIKKVKIEELKAAKYNPRIKLYKNDEAYERIKASIKEFGFVDPIIINADMTVIGGHQRLNILKDLEYKDVDCIVLNLNKKNEKRLNLALNKNSGYWDNTKLEELFKELNLSEEEIFATGFTEEEINSLSTDYINEIFEEEFVNVNNELDKFSVTFNIDKEYEEKFKSYIKENGKENLVNILIEEVERCD